MTRPITLLAVGDVALRADAPQNQLDAIAPVLRTGDITFGQLEMPLTLDGTTQLYTAFRGRPRTDPPSPSQAARFLADAGFTALSFAGNHTLDRGEPAMRATIDAARGAGIAVLGAGPDIASARSPVIVDVRGTRIGLLAYCSVTPPGYEATPTRPGVAPLRARTFYEQVDWQPGTPPRIHTSTYPDDLAAMERDIAELRSQVDVVVVSCHWGIHFEPGTIAAYQYEAAHAAVDAGADLVIGHHAHVIKAIEVYRGKPICYSIGNLTLLPRGDHGEPLTEGGRLDAQFSMVAKCEIADGRISRLSIIPSFLDGRLRPEPLSGDDSRLDEFVSYLERVCLSPSTPRNAWEALYLRGSAEAQGPARTVLRREGDEIVVDLHQDAASAVPVVS